MTRVRCTGGNRSGWEWNRGPEGADQNGKVNVKESEADRMMAACCWPDLEGGDAWEQVARDKEVIQR